MPKTANDLLLDAMTRHQVYLLRLAGAVRNGMNSRLDQTLDKLAGFLQRQDSLKQVNQLSKQFQSEIEKTMREINRIRKPGFEAAEAYSRDQFATMIEGELEFTEKAIQAGIGEKIALSALPATTINNVLALGTWDGRNLDQWYSSWRSGDLLRIEKSVRTGLSNGATLDEITRSIIGTKKQGYTDGIVQTTRQAADTLARTVTNGVTNSARDELYMRNSDIISALRFTATLDARTSEICASLDGNEYATNDMTRPMPPLHPGCRSLYSPVIDGFGVVGDRPSVGGTNFNAEAKDEYISNRTAKGDTKEDANAKWQNLSNSTKNKMRNEQIAKWDKDVIGSVPAKTTYNEWLKTQPAAFQDDVLGKTKAELFRSGGKDRNGEPVTISTFVDANSNKPYTIDQLKVREPQLFREDKKNSDSK